MTGSQGTETMPPGVDDNPMVASPMGSAARTAATMLRRAAKTETAAVYIPHPDGGYVLWAADRKSNEGQPAELRMHWVEPDMGWLWGGDGHYLIIPLGYQGRAGLARLGPWLSPRIGPVRTRAVQRAAQDGAEKLIQASVEERRTGENERLRSEEAAAELIAGPIEDLKELMLSAIKIELDADVVKLDPKGDLVVISARRSSPTAVAILEDGIRQLSNPGDDRLVRYRTLQTLADAVDARASHTFGHSIRVMRVASSISHQMNCDRRTRRTIEVAARLHDVASGFCGSQALSKIKLDDVERDAVRRHPELGSAIVLGAGLPEEVAQAVRGHHERWDGSGYPDNLAGDRAPLAARIIAVAEVFDALISPRPWREGMPVTDAMATLLQGAGTQFDPEVIQAFFAARKQPTQ